MTLDTGIILSIISIIMSLVFGIRAEITKSDLSKYKQHIKQSDLLHDLNIEREAIISTTQECLDAISKITSNYSQGTLNMSLLKLKSKLVRCIDRYPTIFEENGVCDSDMLHIKKLISIINLESMRPDVEMPNLSDANSKATYVSCLESIKNTFAKEFKLYE